MPLSEEISDVLKTLSPALLGEVASYVKGIRDGKPSNGFLPRAGSGSAGQPARSVLRRMDLSVDPTTLRVVECNQASWDTVGVNPLGKHLLDLVDPEYLDPVKKVLESLRRQNETKHLHLRFACADKDHIPAMMTANWVDDNNETLALIHILCRDVTSLPQIGNIEIFSEMLAIGVVLLDEEGCVAFANSAAEKMFGYGSGELENLRLELLLPGLLREALVKPAPLFFHEPVAKREWRGWRKDGAGIALQISLSSIRLGEHSFLVAGIADLTERKSMERSASLHEEQKALIFSDGLAGDFTWNLERDEVVAHPTIFKLYGSHPVTGPVPADWFRARHPSAGVENQRKWLDLFAPTRAPFLEFQVEGDDGVARWLECHEVALREVAGQPRQVYGVMVDITARKQAEKQLRASVREKDAMLCEIHHRVKNNLQIVSSFLNMQAENAGDNAAALRDSERRISTIAMIHEQLYGAANMQTLEFADHAHTLSQSLFASLVQGPRISARFDLSPVELTIDQAIPLALILNELLTNALKYAYPSDQEGEIIVRLSCIEEHVTLTVSDHGVGLPVYVETNLPRTLGLEIVQVLVNQLDGELTVVGSPGASFSVHFRRQGQQYAVADGLSPMSAAAGSL